jgi:site-specific DNA-methyltransferase (adenine-specific)
MLNYKRGGLLIKLYNDDCRNILKLMPDESIDIVLTDIPYGINYDEWDVLHSNTNSALGGSSQHQKENTSFKRRGKPINGWSEADKRMPYEYQEWCRTWMKDLYRATKQASPVLIFSSRRHLHRVCSALEDEGFLIRDILIWKKDRCHTKAQRVQNVLRRRGIYDDTYDDYRIGNMKPMYEPIIWAMKPYEYTLTDRIIKDKIGGFYCKNNIVPSNIIEHPTNPRNEYHPTEKPVELIEELIERFSIDSNHVILDPFMGSGSTGIACKNKDRSFIGIELDEDYFGIAENRINDYVLQKAKPSNPLK